MPFFHRYALLSAATFFLVGFLLLSALAHAEETVGLEYGKPHRLAILHNPQIVESSGLACSRRANRIYWTHNDSGDHPRIFAFDEQGNDRGTVTVTGARARDWEDMASFVLNDRPCLLLADIGDGGTKSRIYTLYLIEEPVLTDGPQPDDSQVPVLQTVHFRYADGSHDGESLGFDPLQKSVVLTTKEMNINRGCGVYTFLWPDHSNTPDNPIVARRIATTEFPMATAMDISPDGRRAVIATYGLGFEFVRSQTQTWEQVLSKAGSPVFLPIRRQGESICYGADGKTLYMTSEKVPTPFFQLRTK